VNKYIYTDILCCLRDAVRRKRTEKWRTNIWFILHDNAPAHRSVEFKNFLAKDVTTLEHRQYSPDLAPADFYLFLPMKSTLKGRRLCDANDIIKNARKELKRLSQNDFQEYFEHLCCGWQKCVVSQGDCFEGNVA
jgi:hypothetical protein